MVNDGGARRRSIWLAGDVGVGHDDQHEVGHLPWAAEPAGGDSAGAAVRPGGDRAGRIVRPGGMPATHARIAMRAGAMALTVIPSRTEWARAWARPMSSAFDAVQWGPRIPPVDAATEYMRTIRPNRRARIGGTTA